MEMRGPSSDNGSLLF